MKNFLYFVGGVVVGSVATFLLTRGYFKKVADDEIASVKDVFSKREKKITEEAKVLEVKPIVRDDTSIFNISEDVSIEEPIPEEEKIEPYVIYPYEFGETGNDTVELLHFSDGYLTDDRYEIVTDVTNTVGDDYADHFGEYEADSVFIRNDRLHIDYEILLDERSYISYVSKYKGDSIEWDDL